MEGIFTGSQGQALLTSPSSCCQSPAPHPGASLKGEGATTPHPSCFSQHPWVTFHPVLVLGEGCGLWGNQAATVGSRTSQADLLTLGFRQLQLGEPKGTPRVRPAGFHHSLTARACSPPQCSGSSGCPCQTARYPCSRDASNLAVGSAH